MKRWVDTSVPEMYKFLAVNFLMGHIRKGELESYWSVDEIEETPFFSRIMPRYRYFLK